MDPLSITASIIAIVGAGGETAKVVWHLASMKGAPALLLALNNEISDLHLAVRAIQDILQKLSAAQQGLDVNIRDSVTSSLQLVNGKVIELEVLRHRLLKSPPGAVPCELNRAVWLRERKRIKRLQEDLRSVRANLGLSLGLLSSSIQPRVEERLMKLQAEVANVQAAQQQSDAAAYERTTRQTVDIYAIHRVITDTQANFNQIDRSQEQGAAGQQICTHQSLTQILGDTEDRVMVKLDRIEAAQLAAVGRSTLASMANRYRFTENTAARALVAPQFQANLSLTFWQCSSSCPCRCHRYSKRKRTPTVLDHLTGFLFMGYLGLPYLSEPCDTIQCLQSSIPSILVVYFFPAWLLARALIILMRYSSATGPELIIRIPRIVNFEASIFQYASDGDLSGIKRLFERGLSSPFDVDPSGRSALMIATNTAGAKQVDICRFLLQAGADPHQADQMNRTPSIRACDMVLSGNAPPDIIEGFQYLFSVSQEIDAREFSLLHKCVLKLGLLDLESLLASLTKPEIDASDNQGSTPCHWAARRGDIASLSLLLKYRADIERQDSIQDRPINSALMSHNSACVRLLLDHGCKIDAVNALGWIPLHGCCYAGFKNDIIDAFLQKGSDLNRRTVEMSMMTPLMFATQENQFEAVQHLMLRGAEPNLSDSSGQCALHIAIRKDNHRCIRRLLEHKADHTIKTDSLESILHYAAQWTGLESLAVLRGSNLHGIDVDARVGTVSDIQNMQVKGLTALEIAERRQDVSSDWLDSFRKLVEGIQDSQKKVPMAPSVDGVDEFHDAYEHHDMT